MPRLVPDSQLASLRGLVAANMDDACVRLTYAATTDAHGQPLATYTAAAAEPCMFRVLRASEQRDRSEVGRVDAEAYVALGATWDNLDRFQLTALHGEALAAPQTYTIVGGPFVVDTAQRLDLRRLYA